MTLDLDAYLDRIGWRGPLAPDLATVSGLLDRHVMTIPFENLDVLLGRPPRLDLDSLQAKLVRARRGGYCYEHATLFAAVLDRIGFTISTHSARVTLVVAKSAAPRTHMFLTVALPEGTFVLDPGFGGITPRVPVPVDGTPVDSGENQFRLVRGTDELVLEVRTPDKTVNAWVSSLARDYPVDFEMANHFTATHPSSPFTRRLMLRAFTEDGRITIANRDVTRFRGPGAETTKLADRKQLRATLAAHFGFDLDVEAIVVPDIPEWT
ncbi:MAG: arylamine N-acetyltransferase [Deltaproteobacteria bacterium]|nr:arylamine N-acetyltransferase [Deltaproteobacteria bacterium]